MHRDLALRNLLVSKNESGKKFIVKVGGIFCCVKFILFIPKRFRLEQKIRTVKNFKEIKVKFLQRVLYENG
jgi:hypothetical protein